MKRRKLLGMAGMAGVLGTAGGGTAAALRQPSSPYYSGPESDHFDGSLFFNPEGVPPREFLDLLRWQLGGGRSPWPREWPSPFPVARPQPVDRPEELRATMVGHATMLIQTRGLSILTDPVWSDRVSPFSFAGPKRVNAPGIAFDDLPRIDAVLLSHNHYDHMDLATLARLVERHDPLIVTPLGNDVLVRGAAPAARIAVGDWGDRFELPGGAVVHIEPTHHWSARGASDRRMALWSAFVVETAAGNVYFAGDTGFHRGVNYRVAREKHGGFRLAILPIGAYEPRWFMEGQHQNPEEAVEGFRLLGADHAIGCHWGTFRLTNEAIDEPRDRLLAALSSAGIPEQRFRPLLPGEVFEV